ncbi:MAG: hypothetical protein ABFS45_24875, partial [Pseudomonadota bacterium]
DRHPARRTGNIHLEETTMLQPNIVKFQGNRLSEPSGVTPLADGRFLVVNDTSVKKALFVLKTKKNGRLKANKLNLPDSLKMDDLEGVVAMDGYYYAVSSHAEDKDKKRRIVRFRVTGNTAHELLDARGSRRLKERIQQVLRAKHPELNKADFAGETFNIEGFAQHGEEFIFGLRGPLMEKSALIVRSNGLRGSFGNSANKYGVTTEFEPLNLDGGGIRAMSYMPNLGGYLIVSGKSVSGTKTFPCTPGSGMKSKFLLWFWDGESCCKKILCFKKKQDKVKIQPEGISPATVGGEPSVLIVSDDGDENEDRQARYWLADLDEYKKLKAQI